MNSRVLQNRWEYRRLGRRSLLWSIFVAALLIAAFFTLLTLAVRVGDTGMAPTLALGDVVLFNRLSHLLSMPARGDIYALREAGGVALGRIIALPGETVAIHNGNVYINGVYLSENAYAQYAALDMEALTLGQGEFFILPDDRSALDLAAASAVYPAAQLMGRAVMILSPLSHVGIF